MVTSVQVQYEDYVTAANTLSAQLREEEGCEVEILTLWCVGNCCHVQAVIALTHMRTPNDIRLAEQVAGLDLILGGHDHVYEKHKVGLWTVDSFWSILLYFTKNFPRLTASTF